MPIVGAGLLPHSPLLLPGLLPEVRAQAVKTSAAIGQLAVELYALQPDVILIIAAQPESIEAAGYHLLQAPKFFSSFAEFGDLVTQGEFTGAVGFTYLLKEGGETKFPLPMLSPVKLPYIFSIPLTYLDKPLNSLPVCCLQVPSQVSLDDLGKLSQLLEEAWARAQARVVVLASGDLAHHLGQAVTESVLFDKLFQAALTNHQLDTLLNIDPAIRWRSRECLWAPAAVLYSGLRQRKITTKVLSYEAPFKVGFLVAQIELG
ncbi:MAG: hypothetical protein HY974_01345 [Candidatus Kerfeldbacteria bacterium]|nr:hypothetical protein [Candidatus Kerfeldbacteria bacterium]